MIYGIIGALPSEIALLTAQMQNKTVTDLAGLRFFKGMLGGQQTVVVKCGVGKVNAAVCTQALIDRFAVDAVINVGIAGGVSPDLQVLDTVVGTKLIQHDFDLTPFGYAKSYMGSGMSADSSQPTVFKADEELALSCKEAAKAICGDTHACYDGVIVSGDAFIAGSEKKAALFETYRALAAEMEGAAIAQTATLSGVPFAVIRTISDLADGHAPISYEEIEKYAADLSAQVVLRMLCTR